MNVTVRFEVALTGRWHRFANIFEMIPPGPAFDALKEDIRVNGVLEPIVVFQGEILDGRNRYMAARDLGAGFPVRDFEGTEAEALAFVMSRNLHRRHLTQAQKVAAAAQAANMPVGNPSFNSANWRNSDTPRQLADHQEAVITTQQAAEAMGVATRTVERAKVVHRDAPELVPAMASGDLSVSLAEQVSRLEPEVRAEVAAAPPEKMREVAREAVKPFVANNTGNNEWYTPTDIIDAAREVLGGFDLDPASSEIANRTVKAARIFTAENDGLAQEWPIGRVWMNPPYAQPLMGQFADRFGAEVRRGSSGIVLVNNATETAWFQTIAAECAAICFPKSRIRFLDPQGNPGAPLQGQAIIYCGEDREAFTAAFSRFGLVVRHGL